MSGSRSAGDDRDEGRPDPSEIYILAPDGSSNRPVADALPGSRTTAPPGRSGGSARGWAALGVVVVLVFLLGLAVGRNTGDGTSAAPGDAGKTGGATSAAGPTGTDAGATTPGPSSARQTSGAGVEDSSHLGSGAVSGSAEASGAATNTAVAWPQVPGACDGQTLLPILSGVSKLQASTGLHLVAGNDPRTVDVDSGTAGTPLFDLKKGEFVTDLATDAHGMVAIVSTCQGFPPGKMVRLGTEGRQTSMAVTKPGYQPDSLVAGGDHVWLSQYPDSAGGIPDLDKPLLLQATDGTGETVTLPSGFSPRTGWGNLIVGSYGEQSSQVYGPIQVYDLNRHGIIAQFGGTAPNYIVGGHYVVWTESNCTGSCPVHRYDLLTGRQTTVRATMPEQAGWAAISPDASRLALLVYSDSPDPRFRTDHPGGPTTIAVVDVTTGRVRNLPGIELAPKSSVGMVFSPDGTWLVVVLDAGNKPRMLLYNRNLEGPLDPGVAVPSPVIWNVPVILAPRPQS